MVVHLLVLFWVLAFSTVFRLHNDSQSVGAITCTNPFIASKYFSTENRKRAHFCHNERKHPSLRSNLQLSGWQSDAPSIEAMTKFLDTQQSMMDVPCGFCACFLVDFYKKKIAKLENETVPVFYKHCVSVRLYNTNTYRHNDCDLISALNWITEECRPTKQ